MKHKASFFYLLLLLPFFGAQAREVPADTLEHALLWRITKPDLKDTSYLFGTIHIISQEDFFLPDGFEEAFAKCQKATFEINMEKMMSPLSLLTMMTNMNMKGDTTLQDLLSEEDYALLEKRSLEIGLPVYLINTMKPFFVAMLFSGEEPEMPPTELSPEESATTSYEMELFQMAKEQNKEIDGLETVDFQMKIFDKIPYTEQAKMLSEALHANDKSESKENDTVNNMEELVSAYKTQDIDKLATLVVEEDETLNQYADLLINERNQTWIASIKKMTAEGPVFFTVGAGHLGGEQGVIRLLRKEGFLVEAVF